MKRSAFAVLAMAFVVGCTDETLAPARGGPRAPAAMRPLLVSAPNLIPLGTPTDFGSSSAVGIAPQGGTAVGWAEDPGGVARAVVWRGGGTAYSLTVLPHPDGALAGRARSVNRAGVIVGVVTLGTGREQAAVWAPDAGDPTGYAYAALPAAAGESGSAAHDINDGGDIAGVSTNGGGTPRAVWWPAGGAAALIPAGGGQSEAYSINNGKQVAGYYLSGAANAERAFVWSSGAGLSEIAGFPVDIENSYALAINDAGTVAGYYFPANDPSQVAPRGYTARAGASAVVRLDLTAVNGRASVAQGLGPGGEAVGRTIDTGLDEAAAVWTPRGALDPLQGSPVGQAFDVNAGGEIVGYVQNAAFSVDEAVLWRVTLNDAPTGGITLSANPAAEGQSITFASAATDPESDDLTYAWDFGDGSTATGRAVARAYVDNLAAAGAAYTTTLTVTDARGAVVTHTADVVVSNALPSVTLAAASSAVMTRPFTLAAGFDDAGAADGPWSYTVDWGDGAAAQSFSAAARGSIAPTHTYAGAGTFSAVLTVTDKDGGSRSATQTVTVAGLGAPVPSFTASPSPTSEGAAVAFDAAATTDPDDNPATELTYAWAFGDGTTGSGRTATHAYVQDGSYTASLTVTDPDANTVTATRTVVVTNAKPAITLADNAVARAGVPYTVSFSFTDAGAQDSPWNWDVAWGASGLSASSGLASSQGTVTATKTYTAAGTYTISVSVRDKDGASASAAQTITVEPNLAPTAKVNGPYGPVVEGTSITYSAAGSSDPEGTTLSYSWMLGNGATSSSASPRTSYPDNGTFWVKLRVRDGFGSWSPWDSTTVTVTNAPPTGSFSTPSLLEGTAFKISIGNQTDRGTADRATLVYAFDCGDGTWVEKGTTRTHACPSPAPDNGPSRTLRGRVTDKDGGTTAYTRARTVGNVSPTPKLARTSAAALNTPISFDASFTDPGVIDQTWTWTVAWGDGTSTTGSRTTPGNAPPTANVIGPLTHRYTTAPVGGSYSVRLTVRDKNSGSRSVTITVPIP